VNSRRTREIQLSLRDPDRFGAVFDRYFTEIHGYLARRLDRDAADDVAGSTPGGAPSGRGCTASSPSS